MGVGAFRGLEVVGGDVTGRLRHNPALPNPNSECEMPKLTVEGVGEYDVPAGKRLILALTEDAGTDQLHACGGVAKCTTCRVEFTSDPPSAMTVAEQQVRAAKGLTDPNVRLSCQLTCDRDMSVRVISRFEGSGRKDAGSPVADGIQPDPQWV